MNQPSPKLTIYFVTVFITIAIILLVELFFQQDDDDDLYVRSTSIR